MRNSRHRTRQRLPSRSSISHRPTAPWILATLLVLVTLAVFWQVHSHEFVLWDDNVNVFEIRRLRSVTLRQYSRLLAYALRPSLYSHHLHAVGCDGCGVPWIPPQPAHWLSHFILNSFIA